LLIVTYTIRRPNFTLNSPQPIVRLATIAVVHHQIINANFVRSADVNYWLLFRLTDC
jgi:hypothetical protein